MSIPKEKHTKEQMMRLLDRAIEQEESLLEKVKILESELADCHKKVENPRHELEEQALPGSKVSFRLDYYRTEKKGPLKGIIEHLPTRESRSFEENRLDEISDFITTFFGAPALLPPKLEIPEPAPIPQQLEAEPFLVIIEGAGTHQRTVRSGQYFQIQISMQALDAFKGKPCSVSLSAKSLEKKPTKSLEMVEYHTPNQDKLNIPVHARLEQGVYRLIVSIALRDEPQNSYYRENRLLIVQ